jgi:hypothetical protein
LNGCAHAWKLMVLYDGFKFFRQYFREDIFLF